MNFIELNFNETSKITINVALIRSIFPTMKSGLTIICMSDEDSFTVMHKYEDVIKVLEFFNDFKIVKW